MLDSQALTDDHSRDDQIYRIVLKALETGWDEEYGGLLRFASRHFRYLLLSTMKCYDDTEWHHRSIFVFWYSL